MKLIKVLILFFLICIYLCSCIDSRVSTSTEHTSNIEHDTSKTVEKKTDKEMIMDILSEIAYAIENKDIEKLSEHVHPINGLRLSVYGYVDVENDLVLTKEELKDFFNNEYSFRYLDGVYDTPFYKDSGINYFIDKIYFEDFSEAVTGYNESVELDYYPTEEGNHKEIYKNNIFVELYFNNNFPESLDWKILRFVFEQYNNKWFLVCIVSDEWTP